MNRQKYKIGDEIEFHIDLRAGWLAGRVADAKADHPAFKGLVYRCETPDFPDSGCSGWVRPRSVRPRGGE